jgi:hypothetical protein
MVKKTKRAVTKEVLPEWRLDRLRLIKRLVEQRNDRVGATPSGEDE